MADKSGGSSEEGKVSTNVARVSPVAMVAPTSPTSPTSNYVITSVVEEIITEVFKIEEFKKGQNPDTDKEERGCVDCGEELKRSYEEDCKECGQGMSPEMPKMTLVGMDAVALFPSLSGKKSGQIVRKRKAEAT